jgi:hypothetical protein
MAADPPWRGAGRCPGEGSPRIGSICALISAADPMDMTVAREGLKLIADRGYQRGRELEVDLDRLLRQGL